MSNRNTKEIVTPSGKKVTIYEYMTGGELRQITALYMDGITASDVMKSDGMESIMSKVPATALFKAQELALKIMLVSVDGCATEDAFKEAMALQEEDVTFLISEIDEYTTGASAKKKESSQPTSTEKQ